MSNIENDIKRCEKLTEPQNANWIGISNQMAIAGVLARIKELEEENKKLKMVRVEYDYGYENIHFCTKNDLVRINKNKYLIEIEEDKFVDLKQVFLENKNSIPKQKVKDELSNLRNMFKATTEGILQEYTVEEIIIKINTLEELLEDK